MSRAADLRADYDALAAKLVTADGAAAAAIVRERRIIGELLEQLATPEEVTKVDELAARRAVTASGRPPARRRQS